MRELSVSIITTAKNSNSTIAHTVNSVLAQTYPEIEYIVVDGFSTDGTIEIIKSYGKKISKFISEPDDGIYDAINKGIMAAGGDIIGILNSDDVFYDDNIIKRVAEEFRQNDIDSVIGDVQFVNPMNIKKIVRYYSSRNFHPGKFKFGYMPAHPSFYAKRQLFEKYGLYKTDYEIAADYELLIRFMYKNKISYKYLGMPFVNMRTGGASTKSVRSNYILNKEIVRACRENGIRTNYFYIYSKYFIKVFELFGNTHSRTKIRFT
jgi:glycosyltransferase involved in cell wall biosynthesis